MPDRLIWIEDFVVVDAGLPTGIALEQIQRSSVNWVVITREGGSYLYAFTRDELWTWPALRLARQQLPAWSAEPLERVLDLHEEYQSTPSTGRDNVPAIDRSWRPAAIAPTIARYIHVSSDQQPLAIGYVAQRRRTRGARRAVVELEQEKEPVLEDEGTSPVRYPAIGADRPLTPAARIVITIDLLHSPANDTEGGAVTFGAQPADWNQLAISVVASCRIIDFDDEGRGVITVHRNAASTPATVIGHVRADATVGESVPVTASFFHGARFCGSARRMLIVAGDSVAQGHTVSAPTRTQGTVVPQPAAAPPDVTVRITKEAARELSWLVETTRFDGLPPKLRQRVTLADDISSEVADLFKTFATLEPGKHVSRMQGFGTRLWTLAPRMFHDVYWALWDRYRRPLTFQFITNEPNLPWELMRPARHDESEVHQPLALMHPVARWLEDFDGYMRNQVPPGGVFTIAPKYAMVSRRLPRAQSESQRLMQNFAAQLVPGTRRGVLQLLETGAGLSVALLHFAGHGQFMRTATTESNIKLEDGPLTASEINRPEVRLGRACRTLVFFNACEVGAVGTIFGEVGGWAEAFLSRQFGGFIAPLWSVEDEDAAVVAEEVLHGIITERKAIGEVLRSVRAKYGDRSPTFYSYLYYGDVTAFLAP